MISRSSRLAGASDRNSRSARNEISANSASVACQPSARAAASRATITHHEFTRCCRLV